MNYCRIVSDEKNYKHVLRQSYNTTEANESVIYHRRHDAGCQNNYRVHTYVLLKVTVLEAVFGFRHFFGGYTVYEFHT